MTLLPAHLILVVAVWAATAQAADGGIYTVVDGDVRVLRGTTWYRLVAGARAQDGDVVDVGEHAQVQLEAAGGGTLSAQGPALWDANGLVPPNGKAPVPVEVVVVRGWFKASVPAARRPLRMLLPTAAVDLADAIAVLHADAGLVEFFVESGAARVSLPVGRGKENPARTARAGEFWTRTGDRAFVTVGHSPSFVAAMPRQLRDALPSLASRFPIAPPPLAAGRDIEFAEAEPWLSGAARRVFVKRLTPRLADPAFRAGVNAHIAAYPEWDRMLHPEKYRPKPADQTNGNAGAAAGPPGSPGSGR